MVFENKIKQTHHLSCLNGQKKKKKKFIVDRELAEEFNKILDVVNANNDIKITNSMLFAGIFKNFLSELEASASETDALKKVQFILLE